MSYILKDYKALKITMKKKNGKSLLCYHKNIELICRYCIRYHRIQIYYNIQENNFLETTKIY